METNLLHLNEQFNQTFELTHKRPVRENVTLGILKVIFTLLAGMPAAAFAAVGTYSEFIASRLVTEMSRGTIILSSLLGVVAFEALLLFLPLLKAWLDKPSHKLAVSAATFLAWAVSAVANTNLILGLLEASESAPGYVWLARVGFVLLTGVSGATIAVLLGEAGGGMIVKYRHEKERADALYTRKIAEWNRERDEAWKASQEYKAIVSYNRRMIRQAKNTSGAPKLDWRTLTQEQLDFLKHASTPEEIMEYFEMAPDQRRTAQNWMNRAKDSET